MGIFDKLFKKEQNNEFLVPLAGEIIDITEVTDEVFAKKMMGDGFAIKPNKQKEVYSPLTGEVASIFETKHAVGIKTQDGLEVLIHVGLDTVNLKGEGFKAHVKQGDKVNAGDLLLEVDFNLIEDKVPSITTPVVFTNLAGYSFEVTKGNVEAKNSENIKLKKEN